MCYSRPELNPESPGQPDTIVFLLSGRNPSSPEEENFRAAVLAEAEAAAASIRADGFRSFAMRALPGAPLPECLLSGRLPLILSDNQELLNSAKDRGIPAAGWIPAADEASAARELRAPFLVRDPGEIWPDDFVKMWQRQRGIPWTLFTTERLLIREAADSDIDDLREIFSDPESALRLPALAGEYGGSRTAAALRLSQYIEHVYPFYGCGYWCLCLKDSGKVIGMAGLSMESGEPELGYIVHPSFRRRGYGLEACRAIVSYAVNELGIARIIAVIPPENEASLSLIRKLGFTRCGDFFRFTAARGYSAPGEGS